MLNTVKFLLTRTLTADFTRLTVLLGVLGVFLFQQLQRQQSDPALVNLVGLVIGYYFGRGSVNGKSNGNGTHREPPAVSNH